MQIASWHMKRCSISLIIRTMQIKTTRYYLTAVRMAVIKKPKNSKCWRECRNKRTLTHCLGKGKFVQLLWKTTWKLGVPLEGDRDFGELCGSLPYSLAFPYLSIQLEKKQNKKPH